MRILISGATGLIGTAATRHFRARGDEVIPLTRNTSNASNDALVWNPANGEIDSAGLEGMNAVIHLAGEPIMGRWTKAKKEAILSSRVDGTRLLCESLAKATRRPGVIVCASGIGCYGDRGDDWLDESSAFGDGFPADVCRAWEGAAEAAKRAGIRVVHLRTGAVLSTRGGALAQMLVPFRLGLGGPVGNGRQYMSWILLEDSVRAIEHAIKTDTLEGPVNIASPEPVTNREFARALGKVLHRPAFLPTPAFLLRLVYGEVADALILSSIRVDPRRLLDSGFTFKHPRIEDALRAVLSSDES